MTTTATPIPTPTCEGCGDSDDTVAEVRLTKRSTAMVCVTCAARDVVMNGLAAEEESDGF